MTQTNHKGEKKVSKQGMTLEIKKWVNRENVEVEIAETGERQWVTYQQFCKGKVYTELWDGGGVPFFYSKLFAGLLLLSIIGTFIAIILTIFK